MKLPAWLVALNLPALLAQINSDLAPLEQIGLASIPGNPAPLVPTENLILQSIIGSTLVHLNNLATGVTPTIAVTAAPIATVVTIAAAQSPVVAPTVAPSPAAQ